MTSQLQSLEAKVQWCKLEYKRTLQINHCSYDESCKLWVTNDKRVIAFDNKHLQTCALKIHSTFNFTGESQSGSRRVGDFDIYLNGNVANNSALRICNWWNTWYW